MRSRFPCLVLLMLPLPAWAAVVRGKVTTSLGRPAPGARVQLIRLSGGSRSVASGIAGLDGSYELRTDLGGRFLLLTSPSILARYVAPQVSQPFYAGRTDLLTRDIALNPTSLTPETSSLPGLRETPVAELASPMTQVPADQLLTQANVLAELRPLPGVFLVQHGPAGSPAEIFLRGAPSAATKVILDGVPAEDLGGGFDLSTLGTTGLGSLDPAAALELARGPYPVQITGAQAGLLGMNTAHSASIRPALTYTGDAGPLATLRNQVEVSAAPNRADLYASVGRFNTANEQLASPYHLITANANLGYRISAATGLRLTARRDVSSAPLPVPLDLFGVQPAGKWAAQNLYGSFSFDTRTAGNWHNALSYGLVRKRTQIDAPQALATGVPVTIHGANGYTATGVAVFPLLPVREDGVTNRDEFTFQSDRPIKPWLIPLLRLRYADERAADIVSGLDQAANRHHLSAALSFTGQIRQRVFYETSGDLDHSPTLGYVGSPRLGLTYAAIHPGTRKFRGTVLHLSLGTGSREPSLLERAATLVPVAPHTRTLEMGADQTILPGRLDLRATYFHNQFSHEFELLALRTPSQTLALRSQGLESELHYQASPSLSLRAGYTYLAALVEQSAASASFNLVFPNLPIGALTALAGARPFHRPPDSGSVTAEYTGKLLAASLKTSIAGRSDDSTHLPQTPGLLLPNRNLSPGYTSMDASVTYVLSRRVTAFTQLTNLFDNRHIAPIGYTSTPFLIRAGLRLRLGGE